MILTILGPPRTKKTHQRLAVNKRTGKPMVLSAKTSAAWEKDAIGQLRRQWDGIPLDCEVSVKALIYRDSRRGDLVGYFQAIGDALQGGGGRKGRVPCVIADDAQIKSWDGSRPLLDRARPRVELTIEPMEPAR